MKKIKYISSLLILFIGINNLAQQVQKDSIKSVVAINAIVQDNEVSFSAKLPELHQIAGAPKAFYTKFWEFGDGHYSTDDTPKHIYKNKGEYQARLYATNNYDDGKPPTTRPRKIAIQAVKSTGFDDENKDLLNAHHGFRTLINRDPVPEEEIQFVVSYANDAAYVRNGKLYVFFNEKKFKNKNFELVDVRTYFGEHPIQETVVADKFRIPDYKDFILASGAEPIVQKFYKEKDTFEKHNLHETLQKANDNYYDVSAWEFDNLQPEETRNLFMTFKTTPEMLKDTTAVISIRSIFVPEKNADLHQIRDKEMEIVTSHDPNKMAVYDTKLNYRLVRFQRMKYKVRFQNNGEGPAKLIKLNVDIPEIYDKTSLKVLDMYPKVPICPDGEEVSYSCLDTIRIKDKISFQFKNIYLPGSNQSGVKDKDSTKGFVKYSLKFGKNFHKIRTKSKTEIIFDKNDPILTNTATTRFATGLSIGVRAGYAFLNPVSSFISSFIPSHDYKSSSAGYFAGITFAPYKPYKWYLQAETGFQLVSYNFSSKNFYTEDSSIGKVLYVNEDRETELTIPQLNFVPVSIRKNIDGIFSWGAGVQFDYWLNQKFKSRTEKSYFNYDPDTGQPIGDELLDLHSISYTENDYPAKLEILPFLDVTAGASRIGPSVGLRYLYPITNGNTSYLQLFARWKF